MRTIQIIVDYKKVIFVLPIVLVLWACQSLGMAGDQSQEKIIFFEIGKEDNSDSEFRSTGFGEYQEYTCEVRVDCLTDTFPQRLHRPPLMGDASRYADAGVQRVTIVIYLRMAYNHVILHLVRGGDETTLVEIDGTQSYSVTNSMLGSNDGYLVGTYDLDLGLLVKGKHSIHLTVADDGKGDGTYRWDAIKMFAR
jgi:hypothetical protein